MVAGEESGARPLRAASLWAKDILVRAWIAEDGEGDRVGSVSEMGIRISPFAMIMLALRSLRNTKLIFMIVVGPFLKVDSRIRGDFPRHRGKSDAGKRLDR